MSMIDEIKSVLKSQGIIPKMLVPFVWGPPGSGKTDITKDIADDLGYKLIDIRLTHYDESVVSGYPFVDQVNGTSVMRFALPEWVTKAHNEPTLVVFDEINRANSNQRNAVLQILCERRLGAYEFPEHVKMIACGNLGEDDGTEVETLDAAHLNRFAHFMWTPSTKQWIDWAEANSVNPCIVSYFRSKEASLFEKSGEQNGEQPKSFMTPRTVTALARLVDSILGTNRHEYAKVKRVVDTYGMAFIGTSYKKIMKFLGDQSDINFRDILNDYKSVQKKVQMLESFRHSEILMEVKDKVPFLKMKESEVKNLSDFLNDIRPDEATGYALSIANELRNSDVDISLNANVVIIKKECRKFFENLQKALNDTKSKE